jgi:hypothetical protein
MVGFSIRSAMIALIMALSFLPCLAKWRQIGLAGKDVTALLSVVIPPADTVLIAGTKSNGVWARKGREGQFLLLDNLGAVSSTPFLKGITNFHLHSKSSLLFAGSDSGLCAYPLVSMIEPMWRKVKTGAESVVTDITGTGDTLFCCTPAEVYRCFNGGTTWEPCSTRKILPGLGNITSFTSLAFCWGVNAGSKFMGALNSWQGVMNSTDPGGEWRDVSNLGPVSRSLGQVFDLVVYRTRYDAQQRLLAVTGDGLKYVEGDLDTGYWHVLDPQLNVMTPKSIHVSYFSRSLISEFWAAGDSGIYVLSSRINTVDWARLYDKKTNCVIDNAAVDPEIWFAGTADGVWEFGGSTGILGIKHPRSRGIAGVHGYFSIDGRRASAGKQNLRGGFSVRVSDDSKKSVIKIDRQP